MDPQKSRPDPQNLNMLAYMAKGIKLQVGLRLLVNDFKEIILDHPSGPSGITRVLNSGKRQKRRSEQCDVRRAQPALAGLEDGGRDPQVKEYRQLQKLVVREMDSSLEPLEEGSLAERP